MAYTPFNKDKPIWGADDGTTTAQHIRNNLTALRDMLVAGTFVGWPGAASGGTAEQPTTITHGSTPTTGTERLRETITWGTTGGATGNPESILYEYSSTSGSSYDTIGTLTYTYDTNGNVTSWTWS